MTIPGTSLEWLKHWALADKRARMFEIRFVAEAPFPWAVELYDEVLGWSVKADCHRSLAAATEHALCLAEAEHLQSKKTP